LKCCILKLCAVYPLQVEVGELKGRLNEVISNCDALCKRISSLGPEALGTTITPFSPSIARGKEDSKLGESKVEISKSDV
jgi:mRNA-degrading endonuclease toxin of MazEF toxin-antitoxin module